jgi:hypothetical protein
MGEVDSSRMSVTIRNSIDCYATEDIVCAVLCCSVVVV